MSYTVTNTFSTQSGNVPASQLDTNFTNCLTGVNNAFLSGAAVTRPAPDGIGNGRYYYATDTQILYRDNGVSWVQVALGVSAVPVLRAYLAGLTLSTAGGSGTMSMAAGVCCDAGGTQMMTLAAFTKTTGAWAVGTGNGALDTGVIANGTWYHWFVIERLDTSVVDVLCSLSATAPTMPANYTVKRRIGSGLTDGAAHWVLFKQFGDYFRWSQSVRDVNDANPGTAMVTSTLGSVPTGVKVKALLNANVKAVADAPMVYLHDLDAVDEAPPTTTGTINIPGDTIGGVGAGTTIIYGGQVEIMTNTAAQIGYRLSASGGGDVFGLITLGWTDYRGRND